MPMRSGLLFALLLTLCLALPASAAFKGPGSPAAAKPGPMTVAEALKATDGTRCVLEGALVEKINRDTYLFQDATGRIQVEIDPDVFGVEVTPANTVRLFGKVDTQSRGRESEVDVKRLELVK